MNDDELERLRKKRLAELQQQQSFEDNMYADQEQQQQEIEKLKQHILRAVLTADARERLGRIRVARPQVADAIDQQLIMLAQSGRLQNKINDEQLQMLISKVLPKKHDIKIRRR
jgi:programmed cell death protein 5